MSAVTRSLPEVSVIWSCAHASRYFFSGRKDNMAAPCTIMRGCEQRFDDMSLDVKQFHSCSQIETR